MKRFFLSLFVLLALFAINEIKASAVTAEEIMDKCEAEAVVPDSETSLSDSVRDILRRAFTGSLDGLLGHTATLVCCAVLLLVSDSISGIKDNKALQTSFDFVSAAVLAAACFPPIYTVFTYTKTAVDSLCAFGASLLPVTASLYAMGGNTAQAVASTASTTLFLNLAQLVASRLLLPLLAVGFAFALLSVFPTGEHNAPVASFIKNTAVALLVFTFSLVCFLFYFRSGVAATADNAAYRGVKFASSTFIPVIGSAVGDSARTVFGAVSVVKSTVGVAGLCVVLGYLLPPLVTVFMYRLAFSAVGLAVRLCGNEKQGKFMGELSSLLGVASALLVACTAVFAVLSAVFMKSGVSA